MDFKHDRRTNTAYVKTLDLELNGNQINLSERPKSKDLSTARKKLARSLRPCALRRPMSAIPSFGYRGLGRNKKMPPWSRPQSAEGSTNLRRSKLAAKFSDSSLHDPDYCAEFGVTYTLSSSQLLNSLMGSCSLNEGLDSDSTPAPSPQPSLGDTIKAAAQLEPGLTSKPPLPPTPSPQARNELMTSDDIINQKFQQWFPDAILESEIIKRTSLVVTPFENQKYEADQLDEGFSVGDGGPLSDRNENSRLSSASNISTFVKKLRTPSNGDEEPKKSTVKFNDNLLGDSELSSQGEKSPKIIIHEPDLYGCDIVTEEFSSDTKIRCLTPDYVNTLKKSSNFAKGKNDKRLSLSDLNDNGSCSRFDERSHSGKVFSGSEIFKDNERNVKSASSGRSSKECFYSDLYKTEEPNLLTTNTSCPPLSRNEIESPFSFETSASKYRLTSTPIANENSKYSSNENIEEIYVISKTNDKPIGEESNPNVVDYCSNTKSNSDEEHTKFNNNNLSPPIRLRSDADEIYHDHLRTYKCLLDDQSSKSINEEGAVGFEGDVKKETNKNKSKHQEKHAHFSNSVESFESPAEIELDQNKHVETNTVKPFHQSTDSQDSHNINGEKSSEWMNCTALENNSNTITEKSNDDQTSDKIYQLLSKHRSGESNGKNLSRKSNKPAKEICRAASVPPFPSSKLPVPLLKQVQTRNGNTHNQNTKKKVRRSMSYDATASPDIPEKDSGVSSYEDIVTMIKVLEKEDLESPVLKYKTSSAVENLVPEQSSSAKAILNFLDEVEKGTMAVVDTDKSLNIPLHTDESFRSTKDIPVSSRLGSLLNTDTAELAQQVMTLTLQLEEKTAVCKAMEDRYKQSVDLLKQQKEENDEANKRQQKFIDQLLKEKRQLAVQYETAIKELEAKHETAIKVIEERHKVEMKKAQDKFNAAEKIRRDKWIDAKTKKIKELTVRGLEPELERMAVSHQEELAELRRVHQRQLTEAEAAWARRTAALREQEASERQAAILHEREAARHRLEQEMNQVEKSYQEQRRRLLEEVRQEKELLQRQSERIIAEKQAEIFKQVDEAKKKLQEKMADYDKQHQEEIIKLRECLETEKAAWMTRQKALLEEKEAGVREELKRERDRHIELVIRRLETEAAAREQAIENKLKRLKESYDAEVNDLDSTLKDLRVRLKNTRADLQKSEDNNAGLKAQLSQAQNELLPLKQTVEKLRKDYSEAIQASETKIAELQRELNETKQSCQEQVNKVHNEKEKQLQQVYTRVKEAISKKEESLLLVTKQRDAALDQCTRLEKLLETQRSQALKL